MRRNRLRAAAPDRRVASRLLVIVSVVAAASCAQGAEFLNLSFEDATPTGQARGWYQGGEGYEVVVDSSEHFDGGNSLRIRFLLEGHFGVATTTFPVNDARGKRICYSGWIRTKDIRNGWGGLWWRVDGREKGETLAFDNMSDRGVTGSTGWTQYKIELDVDASASNISFGVLVCGEGTAWFDALRVELDGEIYEQIPPTRFEAGAEEIAWIRDNAIVFETDEPGAPHNDLTPLQALVGDARIVALGEGTHGTREFFNMKHRLTEFLATEMGFTVFAIEANMPEARAVNEYVTTGEGDPREALAGMYFWTWNTEEVLDMIEWMRAFNASGEGQIEFWGFDMQFPLVAAAAVEAFIEKTEPNHLKSVERSYGKVRKIYEALRHVQEPVDILYEPWRDAARDVLDHLTSKRKHYIKQFDPTDVDWAIQNARVVLQSVNARTERGPSRDESMADNVDWILAHTPPGSKIVLWAHNGHVARGGMMYEPMGKWLAERHGDDMVVFGFAFHDGEYTAVGQNGLGTYRASPSALGSVEWVLHSTGLPRFALDLRGVSEDVPESAWPGRELEFRSIGAMALEYAFFPTVVTDQFDALIFFDETHPSLSLQTLDGPRSQ